MKKISVVVVALFAVNFGFSQKDKIVGNKIILTEKVPIEDYHTIEIHEGYEVVLDANSDKEVKVTADSNLHEFFKFDVKDSVLTIKTSKRIRRAKEITFDVYYSANLKKIVTHNKVNLKTLSTITVPNIEVVANDDSEVFLTIDTDTINCITNHKSKVAIDLTAKKANYKINENSSMKGTVTVEKLHVDMYQKGSAKLEGTSTLFNLRADNSSDFFGESLTSTETSLIAEESSKCHLYTNKKIEIVARGKSKVYLYGEPEINLKSFTNESTLFKKESKNDGLGSND